ncbi:MAG: type II secretion system protein [Campylobacterota bacterium]|nr:type II secretion system protein [Campylobacterota bacterium]
MVRKTNYRTRFAFTMIELIFAIVVIAISVLSLPMMTQVTQRGIENNILQEAIFAASAELMGATAGYWDEVSMQDMSVSHLSRVIDIGTSNDCNDTTKLKPGHINQPFHRRCLDENSTASTNLDKNITAGIYSLDDTKQTDIDIFTDTDRELEGYKDTYTSDINVTRVGNIKTIIATIKSSDGDTVTVLKTQSANIGEIDYYKRTF